MSRMLSVIACAVVLSCAVGCEMINAHNKMMDAAIGGTKTTVDRVSEQGAGQFQAGAQVVNPGIRTAVGVEYYAEARYVGLSGQIMAAMQGALSRPVPEWVLESTERIWRDTSLARVDRFKAATSLITAWMMSDKESKSTTQPYTEDPP